MKLDIDRLKGLAEAATPGTWCADGGDIYRAGDGSYVIFGHGGKRGVIDQDDERFIAAADPFVVLELLKEIQSLRAGWYENEFTDLKFWPEEIEKLKSENEDGLAVIRTLKEQLNCYMKDAERYRILRNERFRPGRLSSNPEMAKYLNEYMICGDKMDAVIDAEIAKEAI